MPEPSAADDVLRHLGFEAGEASDVAPGRYIVAAVGIDAYEQWPRLHNAVGDALGIIRLFHEKLGFLQPFPPLLNAEATADAIRELIEDRLAGMLEADDSLVLFFAGHGHTRVRQVGEHAVESGYLIPVEASTDRWSDYLALDALMVDIGALPARHILLVLDACHSGFALGEVMTVHRAAVRYTQDLGRRRSRKVITSARRDQPAVDSGPVAGHSLFTGTLIDGFEWGTADLDGNGVVTSSELGLFLQQRVGQWSNTVQVPDFGSFRLDDRGEMVISLGDDNFEGVKARAFNALRFRELDAATELVEKAARLRPNSPETIYLHYLLHLLRQEIPEARGCIAQLREMGDAAAVVPLSRHEIDELAVQLGFWGAYLMLPAPVISVGNGETGLPVALDLLVQNEAGGWISAPSRVAAEAERGSATIALVTQGDTVRFRARNLGDAPVHLYYMYVWETGKLNVGPLLEDEVARFEGLPPGGEALGPPFLLQQPPGIYATRILCAPTRISPLLTPPMTATRAVSAPSPAPVDVVAGLICYEISEAARAH